MFKRFGALCLLVVLYSNYTNAQDKVWVSENIKFKALNCQGKDTRLSLKTAPYFFLFNKKDTLLLTESYIEEGSMCSDLKLSLKLELLNLDNGNKIWAQLYKENRTTKVLIFGDSTSEEELECSVFRIQCPNQAKPITDYF